MEKIYTIPVNEAFDKKCGCPFCTIERMLELGVENGQLINALIGISSQRLFKCKGTDRKMVIYETIDSEDIVKYCKYGYLDNGFIPLQKSIDEAYKNNIIEETAYQ